jgi:hypothetical protein
MDYSIVVPRERPPALRVLQLPLAKFLEHAFAQNIALGNEFVGDDGALGKTECDAGHFECHADDAPDFWVGSSIVEEGRARHKVLLAGAGGSATGLSATGLSELPPAVLKP